jgi:hypothetical protein
MPEELGKPENVLGHLMVQTALTASTGTGGTQYFQRSPRRFAEVAGTKGAQRYRRSLDVNGDEVIQMCLRMYEDHARTNDIGGAHGA